MPCLFLKFRTMTRQKIKNKAIKAVFFDIGNVLLHFNPSEILRRMAFVVGRHPFKVARYFWSSRIGEAVERGKISPRQLYGIFCSELGYRGNWKNFRLLWCDHFTLNRGTADLLRKIANSHRVYLLSNTNSLHYDFIRERFSFTRHVHGAILSYKLGLRKPEPEIYMAALRIARVKPDQAVFIDDLRKNVEAARNLGIYALLYKDLKVLKRDLADLGVLP